MRSIAKLMKDWQFTGPNGVTTAVELPHTWNARDGQDGGNDYWRGCCTYCTRFAAPVYDPAQQQVWLQFEGVNASAAVLLNGQQLCTHDGGYSTFRAEVTELLQAENQLTVRVDNSVNDRVYPQKADFTFYGGIYRDVSLLVVNKNHIALGHFGDTGVKITPALQENSADIRVETLVEGSGTVTVELLDAEGRTVAKGEGENTSLHLDAPHLWNGVKDPYLYTCVVRLLQDGQPVDEVTTRVGLRSFSVDAKKGFFLNGKPYPLHGVSRHQDRKGLGNAITREMHDEDMALIRELGANTVRLAHYQHDQYFYDLCDQYGMVVWAEIPYISEHLPNGRENTISQMKELIHQNYNHPSIVCWGVSNEITISTKDKADMLDNHRVLNELCHKMDPTRLTTLACYAMCGPFNLDAGDYYFTAATDSHNAVNNILAAKGYTVAGTNGRMTEDGDVSLVWKWTNEALDTTTYAASANGTAITNLFDESDPNKSSDAPGSVTWMSRSDWTGTVPTQPAALTANETLAADLAFTQYDGTEADSVEMPTLGAKNGLTLASMIGKDFDDPQWETLLDQLTFDEMVNTITLGFHNTAAAASIGKTATKDENGPQGLTAALTGGASAMCYTSEDVMAATFNVDLINEVGKCIGEDCLAMGYSGLYGPGINMHRTAYSGRNFEYYAEDPFVAGTICAAEVQGIQSKGVYVYLKHVALNDSETSRRGVNTWLNEQTAREIYLEVADKAITDGGAWCVMTGFNRWGATWCGANANLLNGFLREELGMRGMCITDFSGSSQYMDLVDGLIAGSDIWDSPMPKIHTTKAANYENDAYIVTQMRNAMHHILYTVVNSNAMNGWSASDTLKTVLPWWQTAIYALIAVLAVLTVLCAWQLSKALKRKKELADTAPAVDQK